MPDEPLSHPDPRDLAAATPEEIAEVLSYALRSDERGKALRGGWDFAAGLAAERLTEHLRWSAFVVMRARPARPHNAGKVAAMVDSDSVIDRPGSLAALRTVVARLEHEPGRAVGSRLFHCGGFDGPM